MQIKNTDVNSATATVNQALLADGSGGAAFSSLGTMAFEAATDYYLATNPSGYTTNTGTVTSIDASGGTTGLTFSGGPITNSGTITMAGTLAVANGGTGGTTQATARTGLGLGTMAVEAAADYLPLTGGTLTGIPVLQRTTPQIEFDETDALADESSWKLLAANGAMRFRAYDDVGGYAEPFAMDRSGGTVTTIDFEGTQLAMNGNEVWDAGNFTPSDYLPLTGGTLTGIVKFPTSAWIQDSNSVNRILFQSGLKTIFQNANPSGTGEGYEFRNASATQIFSINNDGSAVFSGAVTGSNLSGTNTGDQDLSGYLPLTGGTLTGTLLGTKIGLGITPGLYQYLHIAQSVSATARPLAILEDTSAGAGSRDILELRTAAAAAAFKFTNDTSNWRLLIGSNEQFRFDSVLTTGVLNLMKDGKVGINDTTPSEALDVTGNIAATGSFKVGTTQVLAGQGAAVADATDAASAITQLNALLARCRAHGLIAT